MSSWSSDMVFSNSSVFSFESEPSRRGEGDRPVSGLPEPEAPRRAALGVPEDGRDTGAGFLADEEPPIVMPNTLKPDDLRGSGWYCGARGGTSSRGRTGSLLPRELRIAAPMDSTRSGSKPLVSKSEYPRCTGAQTMGSADGTEAPDATPERTIPLWSS